MLEICRRKLVYHIYGLCNKNEKIVGEFELKNQLRRIALSVMNNIAEGLSRFHKNEFKRFLNIVQSSVSELYSMSYVLEDLKYLEKQEIEKMRILIKDAGNLTLGLIKYLNKK